MAVRMCADGFHLLGLAQLGLEQAFLLLGPFPLADVAHQPEDVRSPLVGKGGEVDLHGKGAAILAQMTPFLAERPAAIELPEHGRKKLVVIGMNRRQGGQGQKLLPAVTVLTAEGGIHLDDPAIEGHDEKPVLGRVEDGAILLLAGQQGALRHLAGADIGGDFQPDQAAVHPGDGLVIDIEPLAGPGVLKLPDIRAAGLSPPIEQPGVGAEGAGS